MPSNMASKFATAAMGPPVAAPPLTASHFVAEAARVVVVIVIDPLPRCRCRARLTYDRAMSAADGSGDVPRAGPTAGDAGAVAPYLHREGLIR